MSDEQGETGTEADADAGATDGPVDAVADDGTTEATGNGATASGATGPDAEAAEHASEPAGDAAPVGAIAARLADEEPDAVAAEVAALRETVRTLEGTLADVRAERDDLEDRLKRKAAEFQNYKKRQEKRRAEVRERATEDLVEELLEVRDNLDRALDHGEDADIREGVEATFRQLDEILAAENVEAIEPEPGSGVDPTRHEVLLNVESDHPNGTVASVHRPGYEMAGKVLRPAQVTVAERDSE
jgi:molecular chaperone GrpE